MSDEISVNIYLKIKVPRGWKQMLSKLLANTYNWYTRDRYLRIERKEDVRGVESGT